MISPLRLRDRQLVSVAFYIPLQSGLHNNGGTPSHGSLSLAKIVLYCPYSLAKADGGFRTEMGDIADESVVSALADPFDWQQ